MLINRVIIIPTYSHIRDHIKDHIKEPYQGQPVFENRTEVTIAGPYQIFLGQPLFWACSHAHCWDSQFFENRTEVTIAGTYQIFLGQPLFWACSHAHCWDSQFFILKN